MKNKTEYPAKELRMAKEPKTAKCRVKQEDLKELRPEKPFLIGVDSDGCVFDSMELKHKECFCPAFINHFGLQAVGKAARETWEFVNLYSKTRGLNFLPDCPRAGI